MEGALQGAKAPCPGSVKLPAQGAQRSLTRERNALWVGSAALPGQGARFLSAPLGSALRERGREGGGRSPAA
jgi:hypothetical protein